MHAKRRWICYLSERERERDRKEEEESNSCVTLVFAHRDGELMSCASALTCTKFFTPAFVAARASLAGTSTFTWQNKTKNKKANQTKSRTRQNETRASGTTQRRGNWGQQKIVPLLPCVSSLPTDKVVIAAHRSEQRKKVRKAFSKKKSTKVGIGTFTFHGAFGVVGKERRYRARTPTSSLVERTTGI